MCTTRAECIAVHPTCVLVCLTLTQQERVRDLHKRLQAEHLLRWGGVHSTSAQAACAECVVQLAVAEQLQSLQP